MMNLSNRLTISRMILSLIILLLLLFPWNDLGLTFPTFLVMGKVIVDVKFLIAGVLFIIASITDYLDGKIARKEKIETDTGAILDAVADKFLVNGVLIVLAYLGFISIIVPVVIVLRDIFMDALRLIAAKNNKVIKANKWGKLKTIFMLVGISLMLFYNLPFEIWGIYIAEILIDIATVLSVISAFLYYIEWKDKVKLIEK